MVKPLAATMIKLDFVKALMTMRAQVARPIPGSTDDWGKPGPPTWDIPRDIPCFVQQDAEREPVTLEEIGLVQDLRLVCPADADVTEQDRILSVRARDNDEVLFPGPLAIDAVMPRPPGSFKTLVLRRVAA